MLRLRKLPLRAIPGNMPENITLDITNINIGQSIKVKDLSIPGVTILSSPFNTIVNVKTARGVVAADEDEADAPAAPAEE